MTTPPTYDFFISYPGYLEPAARELRKRLRALGARAFVDVVDQPPGTVVGPDIERVMDASAFTLAVYGPAPGDGKTGYYNVAEVDRGIALEREAGSRHTVVPVQIGALPESEVPLALQPKRRVFCVGAKGYEQSAAMLVRMLSLGAVTPSLHEKRAELETEREAAIERGERKRCGELDKQIMEIDKALRDGEPLAPGQKLGRYVLKEFLGKGGFAEVWRAVDPGPGRVVALKILHRAHHSEPERVRRFFQGASIMRELAAEMRDEIVDVLSERDEADERLFFVMEFVPGGDLDAGRRAGRIGADVAWDLVLRVGCTLAKVHERHKIHRDVKPRNILLGERGPKLTDFDLVRDLEHTFGTKTQQGMGSLVYTAPEVMDDAADAGPSADVYSVAMCLVFARLGRDPTNAEARKLGRLVGGLDLANEQRDALLAGLEETAERPATIAELLYLLGMGSPLVPDDAQVDAPDHQVPTPAPFSALADWEPRPLLPHVEPGESAPGAVLLPESRFRPAMVHIPAGTFMMGSPDDEPKRGADETQHRIRISRPFLLGETQITQSQFLAVMERAPSKFAGVGRRRHPVNNVSWEDAIAFCNALSERDGRTPAWRRDQRGWIRVPGVEGYSLPTEAQWEWACRAATVTRFWSGTTEADLDAIAWFGANSDGRTHEVAEKQRPNPWGLCDMLGNVWEWTADWYAPYNDRTPDDYAGPETGAYRVIRGGSWDNSAAVVRAAVRQVRKHVLGDLDVGFRIVLPAPSKTK